jgi:hypothetical protein
MYRCCECTGCCECIGCCECTGCCECILVGVSWLKTMLQVMAVGILAFPCHVTSYGRTVQSVNRYSPQ